MTQAASLSPGQTVSTAPAPAAPARGLFSNPEFLKLWAGQTVSLLGSQVTGLALPLTAALTLEATATQMGVLNAANTLPFLLVGLFAGVWVDRLRRRPILIAADIGRAALLALVPALAFAGMLRIEALYVVALLAGICTVFFDVAYQSYLPALVSRQALVEGNSKLEISRSAVQLAGPGLAGGLVTWLTAPVAIALDAASYLLSAVFLVAIRTPEPDPAAATTRRNVWREIQEGLAVVLGHPILRSIAGCTGTSNLFSSVFFAVFLLYATRDLGLSPTTLGLIFGIGSAGVLVGAALASRAARWFGFAGALIGSILLAALGLLGQALAGSLLSFSPAAVVITLVVSQFCTSVGLPIYNVNQVSLRQAITPDHLMGRMNASVRFMIWGTMPIGALIGGLLGERIGLQPTLLVGAAGGFLALLWLILTPVRHIRHAADVAPSGG